jgi:hypothetical protein
MNVFQVRRLPVVGFSILTGFILGILSLMSAPASTIQVKNVLPLPGYPIDADTVLRADIAYEIGEFDSGHATYVLVPKFESAVDANRTFNSLPHPSSGLQLTEASGVAHLVYPIRREWGSGKLAKPIHVRFFIMKIGHDHKVIPLTESDVYEYKAL